MLKKYYIGHTNYNNLGFRNRTMGNLRKAAQRAICQIEGGMHLSHWRLRAAATCSNLLYEKS